eukprot:scaffold105534_cov22-Tisochrysis_lutea.AAC.1
MRIGAEGWTRNVRPATSTAVAVCLNPLLFSTRSSGYLLCLLCLAFLAFTHSSHSSLHRCALGWAPGALGALLALMRTRGRIHAAAAAPAVAAAAAAASTIDELDMDGEYAREG